MAPWVVRRATRRGGARATQTNGIGPGKAVVRSILPDPPPSTQTAVTAESPLC